jgi:SNF2 family DNA or RNA helicase
MIITFWKGVFAAQHSPGDEPLLKKCGFELHEPSLCDPSGCKACRAGVGRRYWSPRVEDATRMRQHCNPRALEVMRGHLAKLKASRAVDAEIDIPVPPGLTYKPFQRGGVAYAVRRKDTLFGDQMGLGKTVEALGVINYVKPHNVLVVCPATLVLNWRAEAEKWLCEKRRIFIPRSGADAVPDTSDPLLVITNYEKITGPSARPKNVTLSLIRSAPNTFRQVTTPGYLEDLVTRIKTRGLERPFILTQGADDTDDKLYVHADHYVVLALRQLGWTEVPAVVVPRDFPHAVTARTTPSEIRTDTPLSRSLRRRWNMQVYDEAHALKNRDSLRSQTVLGPGGLYDRADRALFLTGTPMEKRPIEIWPIASRLCPRLFGDWWQFARRYCGLHEEQRGKTKTWVADGATHHSELQQRLRTTIMIRRLRSDVLKELPPKIRQLVVLSDDKVDWGKYPSLCEWREANKEKFDAVLSQAEAATTMAEYQAAVKKLQAVTAPFTQMSQVRHETALVKLPMCLKFADEVLESGVDSLVIFAHHRDVLERIHKHYGEDSCVIFGETPQKDRVPIVKAFQEGQKRIFIGGLRAAGVGITLTRASTMMLFESDWNGAIMLQAEDRVCRIGQTKNTLILHPVLNNSLDAYMVKLTIAEQNIIDKMLDHLPEPEKQKALMMHLARSAPP